MFHNYADPTTLPSPKALQHPPLDALLNKYIDDSIAEIQKAEQERLLKLRSAFISMIKMKVPAARGKTAKNTSPFLSNLRNSNIFKDSFSNSEWEAFIVQFNKIEIKDFKKYPGELPLYLLIRNELELTFYQPPVLTNALDEIIDSIAQNVITDKDFQTLLLNLINLHYLEDDTSLSVNDLKNLSPAITQLIITGLFNKINFIRLVLQQNTKDKNGHYYHRSIVDTTSTAEFINVLFEHEILNQYNLELLFKVFTMLTNKEIKIDINIFLTDVNGFLNRMQTDDYNFYNILVASVPDLNLSFTENELLRIALDAAQIDAQLQNAVTLRYQKLLTGMIEVTVPEEDEKKPHALLADFARTANLNEDELKDIIVTASSATPAVASMLIMLHPDHLVRVDNFIILLTLAKDLRIIELCYSLLNLYKVYADPQETLSRLISIPAENLKAVYELIFWLPEEFRTAVNCNLIVESASYAHDILRTSQFETLLGEPEKSDEQKFHIFTNNLKHKEMLESLLYTYQQIINATRKSDVETFNIFTDKSLESLADIEETSEDNLLDFEKLLFMLANNKIYFPSVLAEISQAELSVSDLNSTAMEETLQVVVENHNSWKTALTYLNNCELIIIDPTVKGYHHQGNAAYFFRRSEDNSSLISVMYSNQINQSLVELELNDDELTTLNSAFIEPVAVLSEDQLALLAQHSKHTHELLPEPIILRLQNLPRSIEFNHLVSLIKCYKIMQASDSLEQIAPFIESQNEYLLELTNGLVLLFESRLFAARYINLLHVRPDLSTIVAEMLYRMAACDQLNDINYLRFSTHLMTYPDFVRQYHHEMSDADLLYFIFYEAHGSPTPPLEADNDDETWDMSTSTATTNSAEFEASRLALSLQLKASAGLTDDEVIGDDTATAEEKYSSNDTDAEPTMKVDFKALVDRCRKDKNSGFCPWLFTRSPFLELVDKRKITTIEQVEAYAKEKPTSRTSRIYLQMKVEMMQDNSPAKQFLQTYFKEYRFSYFQRSQLVPKLLDNCTIDTIQHHADSNPNNRTNAILTRRVR
jgi:hypothetical protein